MLSSLFQSLEWLIPFFAIWLAWQAVKLGLRTRPW